LNLVSIVEISVAMCIVQPAVLVVYALLAAKARDLFTTPRAVRRLNRTSGVAMAGAAALVATR
jgi:threonine/homoserine/homoserine lactone efflux protein